MIIGNEPGGLPGATGFRGGTLEDDQMGALGEIAADRVVAERGA